MPPSHGSEASCPDTTRQGDRNREPATPTCDAYLRPKPQSKTVYPTGTKPRSGPAHYYRVFCRQQVQDAEDQGLFPHPETEASGKHKK